MKIGAFYGSLVAMIFLLCGAWLGVLRPYTAYGALVASLVVCAFATVKNHKPITVYDILRRYEGARR